MSRFTKKNKGGNCVPSGKILFGNGNGSDGKTHLIPIMEPNVTNLLKIQEKDELLMEDLYE